MWQTIRPLFLSLPILWTAPGLAAAKEEAHGDDWEFEVAVYGWGAEIDAETHAGDTIEIDLHDILDDLEFTFMSEIGARKDKWSLRTDLIFLDIEDDEQGSKTVPVGPFGFAVGTDADVELKAWIVTPAIGYTVIDAEKFRLDVLAGARYFWLEGIIEVKITDIFGSRKIRVSDSGNTWDGIVGARGNVNLTDKWYLFYYLDIGTGDSESTWQTLGSFAYRSGKFDAFLGYRYLDWKWDDDDNNDVFKEVTIKGPYAGVKFVF